MATSELSKADRKRARAVASAAWEAELAEALQDLHGLFGEWRKGRLDAHQLADAIHEFHDGPNRELYSRYTTLPVEALAARAIALELVAPTSVPESLQTALASSIEYWRSRDE